LIEFLAGNPLLDENFSKHQEEIFTTSINVAELIYGAWKSQRPEESLSQVEVLFRNIGFLNFTIFSAHKFCAWSTHFGYRWALVSVSQRGQYPPSLPSAPF